MATGVTMNNFLPVTETERLNEYARLAVERHHLLRVMPEDVEEDGGTEELWRVEDKMATGWQQLDEAERHAVSGLTSDLVWVRRKGGLAPKSHSLNDVSILHAKMLLRSLSENRIYEALHYIRVCRPLIGKHLSAVWRASLYREAFLGVASDVFMKAVGEIYPSIVKPFLFPPSEMWAESLQNFPDHPWRYFHRYWMDLWEGLLYDHPKAKFPNGDEAFQQPLLANRLALLMFETMPWPISIMYLRAAVTHFSQDGNVDIAK
jgi:hypothetical protein